MKRFFYFLFIFTTAACSSMLPYKDQNLAYLNDIEQNPQAYYGQVVAFSGEVKGSTEDARHLRLVLKVEAPLYYSVTGKGNALSYQLLLVHFQKDTPAMTGILKGSALRVLARVSQYETRTNSLGEKMGVLHLEAFAVSDKTSSQDFFHLQSPEKQLYQSWKEGRLFFKETPQELEARYPAAPKADPVATPKTTSPAKEVTPKKHIVFDEEVEEFVL
jgi:hypothetical protein